MSGEVDLDPLSSFRLTVLSTYSYPGARGENKPRASTSKGYRCTCTELTARSAGFTQRTVPADVLSPGGPVETMTSRRETPYQLQSWVSMQPVDGM